MTMGREYHRAYSREYYHRRKQELIEMLGGICRSCGSKENLTFDHTDPNSRSFKLGKLLNYSKIRQEEEIKKCQLLCKKCHREKSQKEGSFSKNKLKGSSVWNSKLTEALVIQIKNLLKQKITQQKIADDFKVSRSTIKFISQGRTWAHVTN